MARFRLSDLNPTQAADRDDQAQAQQQSAAALVAGLAELRHHLLVAMPSYVVTDTYVYGGPTTTTNGAYAMANPFQTPAQYRIVQVAFTGAGTVLISGQRGLAAPAPTNTAAIDPTSMLSGQVFAAPGALTVCGSDGWTDVPGGQNVFLSVNVAANTAAFAVIQFRRRISPAGMYAEGHD